MCSISGILLPQRITPAQAEYLDAEFRKLLHRAGDRGRDSYGVSAVSHRGAVSSVREVAPSSRYPGSMIHTDTACVIASCRAEPTTEWIRDKALTDVQPFAVGSWSVAHNGTIANDAELIGSHGWEPSTKIDSVVLPLLLDKIFPEECITPVTLSALLENYIKGSYALAAFNRRDPGALLLAANYKPVYLARDLLTGAVFFSSLEHHFPDRLEDRLMKRPVEPIPPYTANLIRFDFDGELVIRSCALQQPPNDRALVVCSGGLDSTVVAADMIARGYRVTLLHFDYGCRATSPEIRAVRAIGERLCCPVMVVPLGDLFTAVIGASPLTSREKISTEGEGRAGAEFAHEWVPARNLILLAISTGIAEAHGFDVLALGTNLEESGAYPDNEQEFIHRLNRVLPFAVGSKRQVRIETPVGNLMKREIVARGLELGAPMDLTWSCYHAGDHHCGSCGPCFMRARAFEMNGSIDPAFAGERV